MARLRHSLKGYLRLMQMSGSAIYAFVEGRTIDPYLYDQIIADVCNEQQVRYTVARSTDVPSSAPGKGALLYFFKYLRRAKKLINSFKGKITISVFYIDKDVDDILRKRVRNAQVCYTRFYNIENHVYVHGDLARAAAVASSLEVHRVKAGLGDDDAWRRRAADAWKEWSVMCLFARMHRIDCGATYSTVSKINVGTSPQLEPLTLAKYRGLLRQKFQGPQGAFSREYARIGQLVDRAYKRGQHDRFFNGKWYVHFMVESIRAIAGPVPYDSRGVHSRMTTSVVSTLDYKAKWSNHFRAPIEQAIKVLSCEQREAGQTKSP